MSISFLHRSLTKKHITGNNGMGVSKALIQAARPISVFEFADALLSSWRSADGRRPNLLGLAISGGVDSMALAVLCSRLNQAFFSEIHPNHIATVLQHVKFHAFVVDHGVREGSDIEARQVSNVLSQRGITSRVLKIDWGLSGKPMNLPNFESLARKYRYQALGKACRDLDIDSLFLAHHEDDQAETVLMRMINGHRMLGLAGMKRSSKIPECHGIHGVHESSGRTMIGDASKSHQIQTRSILYLTPDGIQTNSRLPGPLAVENGGVRIHRPLLEFSKARLIATCRAERMVWFEDHTNKDPTVTMRNAIRHIYNSHSMPTALATSALLGLARKSEIKNNTLLSAAKECLRESNIWRFETRSGILIIRFIEFDDLTKLRRTRSDTEMIAAFMLREAIGLITPEEHVHLHTLHGAVERIFPKILQHETLSEPTAFTVSSVQFRPLVASQQKVPLNKNITWLVSRQPHSSTHKIPIIPIAPPLPPCFDPPWSPWTLYDGRFWIRIQNKTARPIFLRPFFKSGLKKFRHSLGKANQDLFRLMLKDLAPGDVRWTLPALVTQSPDGGQTVLALPTLHVSLPDIQTYVNWEVKYKKVGNDLQLSGNRLSSIT